MKKIVFVALLLGMMSFATADMFIDQNQYEESVEHVKGKWWDCPRCGRMNSVSDAYCTKCGMRQR